MLLPHLDRFLVGVAFDGKLLGAAPGIVGIERLRAALSEALHQVAHGAFGQLEVFSEFGHRVAFLPALQNRVSDGNGNGSGHEVILHETGQVQNHAPMIFRTAAAAKPNVAINGKSVCRVTEYLTPGLISYYLD